MTKRKIHKFKIECTNEKCKSSNINIEQLYRICGGHKVKINRLVCQDCSKNEIIDYVPITR